VREREREGRGRVETSLPLPPHLCPAPGPAPDAGVGPVGGSLAHFKERVESVKKGSERGIALEGVTAGYEVGEPHPRGQGHAREKQKL